MAKARRRKKNIEIINQSAIASDMLWEWPGEKKEGLDLSPGTSLALWLLGFCTH